MVLQAVPQVLQLLNRKARVSEMVKGVGAHHSLCKFVSIFRATATCNEIVLANRTYLPSCIGETPVSPNSGDQQTARALQMAMCSKTKHEIA